jgi:hypothetical protein
MNNLHLSGHFANFQAKRFSGRAQPLGARRHARNRDGERCQNGEKHREPCPHSRVQVAPPALRRRLAGQTGRPAHTGLTHRLAAASTLPDEPKCRDNTKPFFGCSGVAIGRVTQSPAFQSEGSTMIDSERFKLLYGPYVPPKCRIGDTLPCEYRGRELKVRSVTSTRTRTQFAGAGLRPHHQLSTSVP